MVILTGKEADHKQTQRKAEVVSLGSASKEAARSVPAGKERRRRRRSGGNGDKSTDRSIGAAVFFIVVKIRIATLKQMWPSDTGCTYV